jgi:hypothetical protein
MLKFRKLFTLGVLTAAVSLFMASCADDDDTPKLEAYSATIHNGTMEFTDENGDFTVVNDGGTGLFYENDVVVTIAAIAGPDEVFVRWDVVPSTFNSRFANRTSEETTFRMPARDVVITAVFEEIEGDVAYSATIHNGTMEFVDEDGDLIIVNDGGTGLFFENDVVVTIAALPEPGEVFVRWEVVPASFNSRFDDRFSEETTFRMPARDVVITAVFEEATVDGFAYVRFAWESSWNDAIWYIFASEDDIEGWYDEIWNDPEIVTDDFVFRPTFDPNTQTGIAGLPTIFAKGPTASHNGVEFEVPAGNYIAVASVEDPDHGNIWEIIADYTIEINHAVDPEDTFFELGFWFTNFFSDDPVSIDPETGLGWGWYGDEYEDGDAPRLSKATRMAANRIMTASKKIEKPGATMSVTFYAIPRARR